MGQSLSAGNAAAAIDGRHWHREDDDIKEALVRTSDKMAREFLPQKAQLVKLRHFAGMTFDEAAHALGISEATAKRWWTFSKAWLYRQIHGQEK